MQYYKELEVNHFDVIVNKTITYIKERTSILDVPFDYNWYAVNFVDLVKYVPELDDAFKQYSLVPNFAAFFVVYNNKSTQIHKDMYPLTSRVNFPILNCKGTYTDYYKNVVFQKTTNLITGISSYQVTNTDYELVDSVEIKKATLLNVQEAHKVEVPDGNPIPRITLTIGFDKDPTFLLN